MFDYQEDNIIAFLKKLATTPGPTFAETPRRKVIESFFAERDIPFKTDDVGNLWVCIGKGDFKDTVIFDAHIDVVQEGVADPIEISDTQMIGRGVSDNLSAVSLLCFFVRDLFEHKTQLSRPLIVLFSVGEEGDGNLNGILSFINNYQEIPHLFAAIDISYEEYSTAALGSVRYNVSASGSGGHSFSNYGTVSAIDAVVSFYNLIQEAFETIENKTTSILTRNVGKIQGGEGINSIATQCEMTFEFRSDDPEVLLQLENEVGGCVKELNSESEDNIHIDCRLTGKRPASKARLSDEFENDYLSICMSMGLSPKKIIRSTSINGTLSKGWPSICLGLCKGGNYHRKDEYVILSSLKTGWELLNRYTEALCYEK